MTLHTVPAVLAGAGALVLALGGVETVPDGELDALGIHDVGLPDHVIAEVGGNVVVGQARQVGTFQTQHQGTVLEEGLLYGGGKVEIDVGETDVLGISPAVSLSAQFQLPAAFQAQGVEHLGHEQGLVVEGGLTHA